MKEIKKNFKYQDFIDELSLGTLYGTFIDDTGSPGLSSTPKHLHPERQSWVAVVVPPKYMREVLEQFPAALSELQELTGAKEFHFTEIYSGKKNFSSVDLQIRLGLFQFMAHIFTTYNFPVFVQTFDPDTLNHIRKSGFIYDKVASFDLSKVKDAALLFLLIRVKRYLEEIVPKGRARVFVDEGYKKNGIAINISSWQSVFADGLICFANSASINPIQLADFAAFSLNRSQLLMGKNKLSDLDKRLLEILSPIAWNYQNIEHQIIHLDD